MMMPLSELLFLFWMAPVAYLIVSIPFSVWIGKFFHGIDVREHGSGNAGATNVMRVLGVKTGTPVLILDMLKGFGAVKLIHFQQKISTGDELFMMLSILLGTAAVLGHVFPVFAGFRGGKGVATIAGVCFSICWQATLVATGIFIIVVFITRYVSLGSITAGISYPLSVIFIFQNEFITAWIFSLFVSFLIILTHRKNIDRLIRGAENRASFLFKQKH